MRTLKNRCNLLRALPRGGVVAEIGVFAGDYSAKIMELVAPEKLYLVDWWKPGPVAQGGPWTTGPENLRRVRKRFASELACGTIELVQSVSWEAAQGFPDEHFDWIYIDADHRYEGVHADLTSWRPKVKWDGYVMGHDYCEPAGRNYGVVRAVDEAVARGELEIVTVTEDEFASFMARRLK